MGGWVDDALKVVKYQGSQHRSISQTLSLGSLFLRKPCSSSSTKLSAYFLNFYLYLSFFDWMQVASFPALICFRVSLARYPLAYFSTFSLYSSQIFSSPNYLRAESVILCQLRSPRRQWSAFLVEMVDCWKIFQRRAATSQQSFLWWRSGLIQTMCLRQTVRCFWKLWKDEGLHLAFSEMEKSSSLGSSPDCSFFWSCQPALASGQGSSLARNCSRYWLESPCFKQGRLSGRGASFELCYWRVSVCFSSKKMLMPYWLSILNIDYKYLQTHVLLQSIICTPCFSRPSYPIHPLQPPTILPATTLSFIPYQCDLYLGSSRYQGVSLLWGDQMLTCAAMLFYGQLGGIGRRRTCQSEFGWLVFIIRPINMRFKKVGFSIRDGGRKGDNFAKQATE